VNRHLAFRAKLVLACGDGQSDIDVARKYRTGTSDGFRPTREADANYLRHGKLDLFAALNVASGKVIARCNAGSLTAADVGPYAPTAPKICK
jgi:hypothetical protein